MRVLLLGALVLLASCATSPPDETARAAPMHYRVLATITPTGDLSADVTVTLPPGSPAETDFILGRRFELQPVETSLSAEVQVEATDKPLSGLHGIKIRFADEQRKRATLRFRYSGPIFASKEQDRCW